MSDQLDGIPFFVDINRIIEILAKQIYQSPLALVRENCQNAYDAILQRLHLRHDFKPQIAVEITPTHVVVSDNGVGMTREELIRHYWRAGSSGKNNPEARAAGVVGTFGIGAMANFGIANELTVISESAKESERTRCHAVREKLSAIDKCIDIFSEEPTGTPGTTVIANVPSNSPVDVGAASTYLRQCVRYLTIPVTVNGNLTSQESFENSVPKPPQSWSRKRAGVRLGAQITSDVEIIVARGTGELWIELSNISVSSSPITGVILLRQGAHQIHTFRSRFALAVAGVSSHYALGGSLT